MNCIYRLKKLLLTLGVGVLLITPPVLSGSTPPTIDLWLDRGDGAVYYAGDEMTAYFKVDRPAYVTVYNIDTDGYVNILYPYYPGMDNFVAGGRTYTIPGGGYELGLSIDEPTGIGYIEAVVSDEPFYLEDWPFLSHTYEAVEGVEVIRRISGDPYISIEEINRMILPFSEELIYSDDFAIYYVDEVVHYPRYICSDCHTPGYYHYEPYHDHCSTYYVVVYDYWYYNDFCYWDFYYPYDYYGYYYRFPRSSHVGQRYTRKYDYRTRDAGVYQSKGEAVLSAGAIRVRESDGSSGVRKAAPVTVREDANGSGTSVRFQDKRTVSENTTVIPTRSSHVRVSEENGYSRRDEAVSTRTVEKRTVPEENRSRTTTKVTVNEGNRSSQDVKRTEKRIERGERNEERREIRTRNTERVSGGERNEERREIRTRNTERVTGDERGREVRNSTREAVRARESRPEPRRNPEVGRSERSVTRNNGNPGSRGIREVGIRTDSRPTGNRSPSGTGEVQKGTGRGSGVRR